MKSAARRGSSASQRYLLVQCICHCVCRLRSQIECRNAFANVCARRMRMQYAVKNKSMWLWHLCYVHRVGTRHGTPRRREKIGRHPRPSAGGEWESEHLQCLLRRMSLSVCVLRVFRTSLCICQAHSCKTTIKTLHFNTAMKCYNNVNAFW